MRQKFAEDEAREREEESNRKNMKQHHMSLIERQRSDRKSMYDQERAAEAAAIDEANQREDYRKRVIQEARKRLLEEHAAKLVGYMPTRVFESKEELEHFNSAAAQNSGRRY